MKELAVATNLDRLWSAADKAHAKGLDAYIEFGNACAALNDAGESQARIAERYEMSQSAVSRAIAVGSDDRIIRIPNNQLPRSQHTLYLLTTLDDKGISKLAKAETTEQMVLEYKATVEAPKPDPEKPAKKGRPRKTAAKPETQARYSWIGVFADAAGLTASRAADSRLQQSFLKWAREQDPELQHRNREHETALRTLAARWARAHRKTDEPAPPKVDTSHLKAAEQKKFDSLVQEAVKAELHELQQSFRAEVRKGIEAKIGTHAKEQIKEARDNAARDKEQAALWRNRAQACKAMLKLFDGNWRSIAASVHPDRPERSKEQLEKSSAALNKIKSAFDKIDFEKWGA